MYVCVSLCCGTIFNQKLTVTELLLILWLPSVAWSAPYWHTHTPVCVCMCVHAWYPGVFVCVCGPWLSVRRLGPNLRRAWGVISKAQHWTCLGLIGSCSCQRSTCGTYFRGEVSLAEGVGQFGGPLAKWASVMIILQSPLIHRSMTGISAITIQEADWNAVSLKFERPAWRNNQQLGWMNCISVFPLR